MNIVVLDGYTLNPGDLSWKDLESQGSCKIYDRTPAHRVVSRCKGVQIVLTNKTPISRKDIEQLTDLKYIGVMATGYNIVDVGAARERGIPVTNVPTYGTKSVAQMVFALLLELMQHVGHHATTVRAGRWSESADWCYWDHPLIEMDGLTMGLIGFGRIGQATGSIASAFGMKILAFDPAVSTNLPEYVSMVDLETVLKNSDIISLHCPLTPENEKFLNKDRINLMKKSAFLINTSRGPLVDEHDLAKSLNEECIAGAGLDVLSVEPPGSDNPLLTAKNCLITPHISWATKAARFRLMSIVVKNLHAFLEGTVENVVN
jgi:glycerate dehydrogenase